MKSRKGFTLAELLLVVAIIGVLVAISLPTFARLRAQKKEEACAYKLRTLQDKAVSERIANPTSGKTVKDYAKELFTNNFESITDCGSFAWTGDDNEGLAYFSGQTTPTVTAKTEVVATWNELKPDQSITAAPIPTATSTTSELTTNSESKPIMPDISHTENNILNDFNDLKISIREDNARYRIGSLVQDISNNKLYLVINWDIGGTLDNFQNTYNVIEITSTTSFQSFNTFSDFFIEYKNKDIQRGQIFRINSTYYVANQNIMQGWEDNGKKDNLVQIGA